MAEQTEQAEKHYISHPGGVILHLKGGSSEYYAYGAEIDSEELAEHQQKTLHRFTDGQHRGAATEAARERIAHRNAIFADAGQVNSTSDPVPGNYDQLSEDEAAQLVLALQNQPETAARILLHERVGQGRQSVLDAGTDEARQLADLLYSDLKAGNARFAHTQLPDQEREVEREVQRTSRSARSHAKSGGDKGTPPPAE